MTVKELITFLLDKPMDTAVVLHDNINTSEYSDPDFYFTRIEKKASNDDRDEYEDAIVIY